MNRKIAALIALLLGTQSIALADSLQANLISSGVSTGICPSQSVQSIPGSLMCFSLTDGVPFLTVDTTGNVGIRQNVASNNVGTGSPITVPYEAAGGNANFGSTTAGPQNSDRNPTSAMFANLTIKTLNVTCYPSIVGDPGNPYTPSTTITGGVMTFYNAGTSVVTIGSVTLPNSPGSGPFVNHAQTVLGTPFTVPANSEVYANITTSNGNTNPWNFCTAVAGI